MLHAAFLMPLLPLVGFAVLISVGRRLGDPVAGVVATLAVAGSFAASCVVMVGLLHRAAGQRAYTQTSFDWIHVGTLNVKAALLVDPLSMTMCLFVTGVSTLIHLYSIGYMKSDRDYAKFFMYLNLFVFSMLVLVLADNLLVTFVGWEGVGVCSYWLVSFWFDRPAAASAGKKAFVYNRVGDVGFLIAMFLIFSRVHSLDYSAIDAHVGLLAGGAGTAAVLLLLLAAAGKSAQIPLFNWLPDAMEGPTPVSALIHAATMVTAGVYLLCRMNVVLEVSPDARWIIAAIGLATAFVAATVASAQQDIKKVLAFSTVSQIGYMIMAVGVRAYVAAIFLMVCHAFYKALLFLGAGSVIHGLEDEQDLKRMGALRRFMKWTTITFTVGWLTIAGIPPLSAFFSKGDVLDNVWSVSKGMYVVAAVTSLLTAYYMSRLYFLAFAGEPRWQEEPAHHPPHEPGWVMLLPLWVLAAASILGGLLDLPGLAHHTLATWLQPVFATDLLHASQGTSLKWALASVEAVLAVGGVALAWRLWRGRIDSRVLEPPFLQRVWYWDDVYDRTIGRPGQALARFSATVVEGRVIDGAVNGVGTLVRSTGSVARRAQTGYVRNYALGIAVGMAAIVAFFFSRTWW